MFRSDVPLHVKPSLEVKTTDSDTLYVFSGKCEKCDKYVYRHPCEAGAMWYLSGEISLKYSGVNKICSVCYR